MSLLAVQLISLSILLTGTFVCGVLPVLCFTFGRRFFIGDKQKKTDRVTSFLIYFGGGVLLSTALLHLLPEAREGFEDFHHSEYELQNSSRNETEGPKLERHSPECTYHHTHGFPLPEFIVMCGFFATYFIEVTIMAVMDKSKTKQEPRQAFRARFCSCSQRNIECSQTFKNISIAQAAAPAPAPAPQSKRKRSSTWGGHAFSSNKAEEKHEYDSPPDLLQSSIVTQLYPNYGAMSESHHGRVIHVEGGITIAPRAVAAPPLLPNIPEAEALATSNKQMGALSVASLLTVAALSFHSVFEGFAVGFQQTELGTWTLLLAISLHKFVIAFVIGVEAAADGSRASLIVASMAIFASMSPVGVGIGMAIGPAVKEVPNIAIGVVNCMATGTLLYVTFFEIWGRKGKDVLCTHRRFFAMAFGSMAMAAVQYATTFI